MPFELQQWHSPQHQLLQDLREVAPARIESVRGHGYRLHAEPA